MCYQDLQYYKEQWNLLIIVLKIIRMSLIVGIKVVTIKDLIVFINQLILSSRDFDFYECPRLYYDLQFYIINILKKKRGYL